MDRDEFYALHNEANKKTGAMALRKSLAMHLPKKVELSDEITGLGRKSSREAMKLYGELKEEFGGDLAVKIAIALHEYWFACWDAASYFVLCAENGAMRNTKYTRRMSTAQGYADDYGWAGTLINGLSDIHPKSERIVFIKTSMNAPIMDINVALRCMALYWFHQAANHAALGEHEAAADLLYEAFSALESTVVSRVWEDAWGEATRQSEESSPTVEQRARSENASRAALARYANNPVAIEKKAAKGFAKECWDSWQENPDRYRSQGAFANDILTKIGTDRDGNPIITYSSIVNKFIPEWNRLGK
jgi:hypothetical protein